MCQVPNNATSIQKIICFIRNSSLEYDISKMFLIPVDASKFATAVYDYAVLAALAYDDDEQNLSLPLGWTEINNAPTELLERRRRCCKIGNVNCRVFVANGKTPKEVVLAFPGTRSGHKIGDWWANFRCCTNFVWFVDDRYSLVEHNIGRLLSWVKSEYNNSVIITVGHSLGGGLAQNAAYKGGSVHSVYTFNTSFLTGWYDKTHDREKRKQNSEGLHIFRIYESREILADIWWFMEKFYPLACKPGPIITRIRFHTIERFFNKHSICNFIDGLRGLAQGNKEGKRHLPELVKHSIKTVLWLKGFSR